jgi:hypothetical protein
MTALERLATRSGSFAEACCLLIGSAGIRFGLIRELRRMLLPERLRASMVLYCRAGASLWCGKGSV